MAEIKCPNCGEVFKVDESDYDQILKQVRDKEFLREIDQKKIDLETIKNREIEVLSLRQKEDFEKELTQKNNLIKDLENKISLHDTTIKLAISEATNNKDKQIKSIVEQKDNELIKKNELIEELKAKLLNSENEKKLAISNLENQKDKELNEKLITINDLKNKLSNSQSENELTRQNLKREFEKELRIKDEQIEYYKDFKARQSTKMIGESLEQHCLNEFNSLRMTAFPDAYFEKDNEVKQGSKGDFIFRDYKDGMEYISIMFEMKNEADATASKHKNEDFFKELDKDRKLKNCEYAVLVSLLEIDNDFYNNGIVDVSYKYEKMYVVRPQFFIPIITLLRNAALNSLKYQLELETYKHQQLDILNFEENMNSFKEAFGRNYRIASDKFKAAIDEIDKTIQHLNKIKEALLSSENNLRLANNKADDLSIKKLTKNAPSIAKMFEDAKK